LTFDFHRDFVPIGMIGTQPLLIAASPKLGVSSLPELIALAKKEPRKILFAGNTPGTLPALTGEMLKQRAGIDMTFIPYPGFAAGLTDLKGGRISVIFESMSALAPAIRDGSVKFLAVASDRRLAQYPDVPTFAENLAWLPGDRLACFAGANRHARFDRANAEHRAARISCRRHLEEKVRRSCHLADSDVAGRNASFHWA
jgi:tripartite-type tricarboxylate transporter receptor subunit TctC